MIIQQNSGSCRELMLPEPPVNDNLEEIHIWLERLSSKNVFSLKLTLAKLTRLIKHSSQVKVINIRLVFDDKCGWKKPHLFKFFKFLFQKKKQNDFEVWLYA